MTLNAQLGKSNPPSQVAYREITPIDMKDPRLAGLNNLLLQITQAVNGVLGYNGVTVLVGGEQLNGNLDLHGNSVINASQISPSTLPAITGSKGGNAALASLITALATLGLVKDGTS